MWSPASPDLNIINFLVCSMLKVKVSCVAHINVDALKTSLLRDWANIPLETLRVSVGTFREKLKLLSCGKSKIL